MHREPQGPWKDDSTWMCPQHHSQEEEEEHIPTPVAAQARMQMSTLHPLSEGRGVAFPPKQAPSPTADSKAPSGEGKSSALPEAQGTPLSQGSSWTVRFKELFHSGKRKARVKRKSAGQRRGIPAPGARHSAPRAARSPQNPAASPPSAGTLAHAPALTSFLTEGSSSHRQWVGARAPSRPLCRIQSWIPLPMPPKPHLEQSKRRYCWFSFP